MIDLTYVRLLDVDACPNYLPFPVDSLKEPRETQDNGSLGPGLTDDTMNSTNFKFTTGLNMAELSVL